MCLKMVPGEVHIPCPSFNLQKKITYAKFGDKHAESVLRRIRKWSIGVQHVYNTIKQKIVFNSLVLG